MGSINWEALRALDGIGAEIFATPQGDPFRVSCPSYTEVHARPHCPAAQEMLDARKYAKDPFEREILSWEAERLDSLT